MHKLTLNKSDILKAINVELPNMRGGEFFHLNTGMFIYDYNVLNPPESRYSLTSSTDLASCKVCAIGGILRQTFGVENIIDNKLISRAVGEYYCCDDIDELPEHKSPKEIVEIFEDDEAVIWNLSEPNNKYLGALSCVFESLYSQENMNNDFLLESLTLFVNRNFPDEITI